MTNSIEQLTKRNARLYFKQYLMAAPSAFSYLEKELGVKSGELKFNDEALRYSFEHLLKELKTQVGISIPNQKMNNKEMLEWIRDRRHWTIENDSMYPIWSNLNVSSTEFAIKEYLPNGIVCLMDAISYQLADALCIKNTNVHWSIFWEAGTTESYRTILAGFNTPAQPINFVKNIGRNYLFRRQNSSIDYIMRAFDYYDIKISRNFKKEERALGVLYGKSVDEIETMICQYVSGAPTKNEANNIPPTFTFDLEKESICTYRLTFDDSSGVIRNENNHFEVENKISMIEGVTDIYRQDREVFIITVKLGVELTKSQMSKILS